VVGLGRINIPPDVLIRLAQEKILKDEPEDAYDLLAYITQSLPEAVKLRSRAAYLAGLKACATGSYSKAEEYLRFVRDNHPMQIYRELASIRLRLLKRRPEHLREDELMRYGRNCDPCHFGKPSLYNCGRCPKYGCKVKEPDKVKLDILSPEIDLFCTPAVYRSAYDPERCNPFSQLMRLVKRGGEDAKHACYVLGRFLADYLSTNIKLLSTVDIIIPIPTSEDRIAERGYSIPEELAGAIERWLFIPTSPSVLRLTKQTPDLRYLPYHERWCVLEGAFQIARPEFVSGLCVLLVDDIMTSGSTLRRAAIEVRKYSPSAVYAVVLAHTESSWW